MENAPISEDRQKAIRLMVACGWTHRRKGHVHEFWGEGCSLHGYDVCRVNHKNLSTRWALNKCQNAELHRRIEAVKTTWLAEFLPERVSQ